MRTLPDFIIIGAMKSGTTLYNYICEHPCVLPVAYDEIGFYIKKFGYDKMNDSTREKLIEFYKPINEKLFKLIGKKPNWN